MSSPRKADGPGEHLVARGVKNRDLTLEDRDERVAPVADAIEHLTGVRGPLLAQRTASVASWDADNVGLRDSPSPGSWSLTLHQAIQPRSATTRRAAVLRSSRRVAAAALLLERVDHLVHTGDMLFSTNADMWSTRWVSRASDPAPAAVVVLGHVEQTERDDLVLVADVAGVTARSAGRLLVARIHAFLNCSSFPASGAGR